MAKVLYFDAFNGAAGDMILGALVDLGLPVDFLSEELRKLPLSPYEIRVDRVSREGMSGMDLRVVCPQPEEHPNEGHSHSHKGHHHFGEIRDLIQESGLDEWVKNASVSIFTRLAEAEAKVHGSTVESVHFHEVGAIDSIVDIVGACIGFKYFNIEQFASSTLELGGGVVTFSHGTWPVPAPATAELVKGFPVRLGGAEAELTTPTGAAIVTTLASKHGFPDAFEIENVGLGAGDREIGGIPNMLRLIFGKSADNLDAGELPGTGTYQTKDRVVVLEMNIDDMLPEDSGYFMERALEEGALDVFFTPVFMKKNRPATQITVLSAEGKEEQLVNLIFRETT
ncbi:MAG: nickel pincer cofactor biosynthesis protein LarC, partial [Acidobacteriota bacterium]